MIWLEFVFFAYVITLLLHGGHSDTTKSALKSNENEKQLRKTVTWKTPEPILGEDGVAPLACPYQVHTSVRHLPESVSGDRTLAVSFGPGKLKEMRLESDAFLHCVLDCSVNDQSDLHTLIPPKSIRYPIIVDTVENLRFSNFLNMQKSLGNLLLIFSEYGLFLFSDSKTAPVLLTEKAFFVKLNNRGIASEIHAFFLMLEFKVTRKLIRAGTKGRVWLGSMSYRTFGPLDSLRRRKEDVWNALRQIKEPRETILALTEKINDVQVEIEAIKARFVSFIYQSIQSKVENLRITTREELIAVLDLPDRSPAVTFLDTSVLMSEEVFILSLELTQRLRNMLLSTIFKVYRTPPSMKTFYEFQLHAIWKMISSTHKTYEEISYYKFRMVYKRVIDLIQKDLQLLKELAKIASESFGIASPNWRHLTNTLQSALKAKTSKHSKSSWLFGWATPRVPITIPIIQSRLRTTSREYEIFIININETIRRILVATCSLLLGNALNVRVDHIKRTAGLDHAGNVTIGNSYTGFETINMVKLITIQSLKEMLSM